MTAAGSELALWLGRLAVIDDEVKPGELHLLRLVPRAWLRTDRDTRFERIPTTSGPVDLRFRLADGGETLDVSFTARFRGAPPRVFIHAPPVPSLRRLRVGGRELAWHGEATVEVRQP